MSKVSISNICKITCKHHTQTGITLKYNLCFTVGRYILEKNYKINIVINFGISSTNSDQLVTVQGSRPQTATKCRVAKFHFIIIITIILL